MPDVINHETNCDDCKEIAKETAMTGAYREAINQDFEKILDKKLQIQSTTLERVSKIERIIFWLIGINIIEMGTLLFLIYNYYHK